MRTKLPSNRKLARAAGQQRYLGSQCIRGHSGERYVANGSCIECSVGRTGPGSATQWRKDNRERSNAYMRNYLAKWREENREYYNSKARDYQRRYREERKQASEREKS